MSTYWVRYKGTRFPIRRGETILGRSPYCSIVISDDLVSREHCALRLNTNGLMIVDLNSTNGITVNAERVRGSRVLQSGDVIGLGTALLEVLRVDSSVRPWARMTTRSAMEEQLNSRQSDESQATLTQANSLELIEALVGSSHEPQHLHQVASTVRRAVDEFTRRLVESGKPAPEASRKLQRATSTLASWFEDGSLDEWRDSVVSILTELDR